jgi:hypothetical protein
MARNRSAADLAVLGSLLVLCSLTARALARDLRAHPANFPDSTGAHGLRMTVTGADGREAPRL